MPGRGEPRAQVPWRALTFAAVGCCLAAFEAGPETGREAGAQVGLNPTEAGNLMVKVVAGF